MVSLTGEYALRAVVYLARHADEWPIPGHTIAQETGIPRKYLLSILGTLVRGGILHSSPGRGGGFSLARPAQDVLLYEVLVPFEQALATRRSCLFGNAECNDDDPCPAHDRWSKVCEEYSRFLKGTSVHTAAFQGQKRGGSGAKRRKKR